MRLFCSPQWCCVDAYRSDVLDGMEICNLCHKRNTMSIPTIQTHCIELAIFVTKITMSIPTIKNTMHGIDILDDMEIGHGMEMLDGIEMLDGMEILDGMEMWDGMEIGNLCNKKHNVNTNNPNALY